MHRLYLAATIGLSYLITHEIIIELLWPISTLLTFDLLVGIVDKVTPHGGRRPW